MIRTVAVYLFRLISVGILAFSLFMALMMMASSHRIPASTWYFALAYIIGSSICSIIGFFIPTRSKVTGNDTQPKVTDEAPETYKKPAVDEMLLKCQWIYANGKMHGDVNCNRIEWLVTHYLIKTDTRDGGWTTIYKDPEDGRYWVRNFPHGEMHGGGPPQLYCIGDNCDHLYNGMTVNERLHVSGSLDSFDTAVKQNDVEAAIAILRRVELEDESIDAILRNNGLRH